MVQGIWPVVGCVDEKYNPIYQTACTENKARLEGQSHVSNHSHKCKFKVFQLPVSCFKIAYFCSGLSYLVSIPLAADMSNVFHGYPSISCVRLPEPGRHGTLYLIHPRPFFSLLLLSFSPSFIWTLSSCSYFFPA